MTIHNQISPIITDTNPSELNQHDLHTEITHLNSTIQDLLANIQSSDFIQPLAMSDLTQLIYKLSDGINTVLLEKNNIISALREGETHFHQLFDKHSSVMLLIDYQSFIIVDANPAAAKFYGYPLENLRGMHVNLINAQPESEIYPQRQKAIIGEQTKFIFDHKLCTGEIRTVEAHISIVHYKGNNLFFSIIHDITERKQSEEQIRNLAFYDALTQLPNRHLFIDRLSQVMATSKRNGQQLRS